jgi:7-keto-8-aminopelargonate synthetase-like enzyme
MQLKEELKDYWGLKEVILFSAGWLAGFGVIKGLIRYFLFELDLMILLLWMNYVIIA